jgi:anti-sigma regulatory factor (Ser/Thr protein kinase)
MPSKTFLAWPQAVPQARRFVTDRIGADLLHQLSPQLCQTAALLVSELATNAVRHAGVSVFTVEVETFPAEGRLRVGVTDAGPGQPVLHTPPVTEEHGRGLFLVSTLADRWGAGRRRHTEEKTVWFELHTWPGPGRSHGGTAPQLGQPLTDD